MRKELKETVGLMLSKDYEDRFKAGYYQAVIRRKKLKDYMDNFFSNLSDKHGCDDDSLYCTLLESETDLGMFIEDMEKLAKQFGIELEDK